MSFSQKIYHTNRYLPNQCIHCDKSFSQKQSLLMHLRIHIGEEPHRCIHCGEIFSKKSTLLTHLRTHTKEKPFQCSHCDKDFSKKSTLITHIRTHSEVYLNVHSPASCTFVCHICYKTIKSKESLEIHLNKHTNKSTIRDLRETILLDSSKESNRIHVMDSNLCHSPEIVTVTKLDNNILIPEHYFSIKVNQELDDDNLDTTTLVKQEKLDDDVEVKEEDMLDTIPSVKLEELDFKFMDSNFCHSPEKVTVTKLKNDILIPESYVSIRVNQELDDNNIDTPTLVKQEKLDDVEVKEEDILDTIPSVKHEELDFKFMAKGKKGHRKPNLLPVAVHNDKVDHLPYICKTRYNCKNLECTHRSNVYCLKCNAVLCVNGNRNCFAIYHGTMKNGKTVSRTHTDRNIHNPASCIFICHICYKTIKSKESLKIHLNTHTNKSTISDLRETILFDSSKESIRIHVIEKPNLLLVTEHNDKVDHLPNFGETRYKCTNPECTYKSNVYCLKCKAALCLNGDRNCFAIFHGVDPYQLAMFDR